MAEEDRRGAAVSRDVDTYRSAVMTAQLCANLLAQHPIAELIADIDRAESFGPVLDPTLYRDKAKAMREDRTLLEAALKLRKFGKVEGT